MFARAAVVAVLPLITLGSAAMSEEVSRPPENAASRPTTCTGLTAECNLEIGRSYLSHHNYPVAINRFKVVVTRFASSPVVDEALFRLVQAYLALGIRNEAQTAAAVLNRKFPDSHWRSDALDMLKAAGLEPVEDEKSWIRM